MHSPLGLKTIRLNYLTSLFLLSLITNNCYSAESKLYVKAQVGLGTFHVDDSNYLFDTNKAHSEFDKRLFNSDESPNSITVTNTEGVMSVGFRFSNGLILETGLQYADEAFFLHDPSDGYTRSETHIMFGYRTPISPKVSFTSKLGINRWKLNFKDKDVDSNRISEDFYGTDPLLGFDLGFDINKYLGFNWGVQFAQYDFGRTFFSGFGLVVSF